MCSECYAICLNCDACISECCLIGGMLVSLCKYSVLVFLVHPVAMRTAVFCMVCVCV